MAIDTLLATRVSGPTGPLGCRIWSGATSGRGYPLACVNGRNQQVRRLVYEREKRELLSGERVEMECGERLCVEAQHMHARPRSSR